MGWKLRLAVVASVLWVLAVYGLASGGSDSTTIVLVVGILPVAFLWGVGWIVRGYIQQRRHYASTVHPVQATASADPLTLPLATRWPRFLARVFDVWWETMVVGYCLSFVLNRYSAAFVEWSNRPGSDALFGMLCLPLGLVLDAFLYSLLGNTPGKALLGLKVMTFRGNQLTLSEYLTRNMTLWVSGMALGFPIANLITMAVQSHRLSKGRPASYDEASRFSVRATRTSWMLKTAFGLSFMGLLFLLAVLRSTALPDVPVNAKAYKWENPITGLATTIDPRWVYSAQKNLDGQDVHIFTERAQRAVVAFAFERAPGYTLTRYVNSFQKNTVTQMRFADPGIFSTASGRPSWQGHGSMVEAGSNRLNARVVQAQGGFWRLVATQAMPYDYSETPLNQLQAALWNTVPVASQQ